MKLIGSRIERQMRDELVRSNLALQDGTHGRLANILESLNVNVAGALVLHSIPEQAEDIYFVLVSAHEIAVIEIPRGEGLASAARIELAEYDGTCPKNQRLKIAVALDLLSSRELQDVR